MSADPSTTEQIAAAVLAEHEDTIDSTNDSIMAVCTCGEVHVVWVGQGAPPMGDRFYPDSFTAHRAHVAQQIAARLDGELDRLHSWAGLMELLDEHWPADIFPTVAPDDRGRDTGPRIVSLLRWVATLLDQTRTEADR